MLRLYVCRTCQQYFPAPSEENVCCPKCEKTAVPTEYYMVDLLKNNAHVTRDIYRKYDIDYEEFTDMMDRVDKEERLQRTIRYKIRLFFNAVKGLLDFVISGIKKLFIRT